MKIESMRDLYVNHLQDLYDSETELSKFLPKMQEAVGSSEFRNVLEQQLRETRIHMRRLEDVFGMHGEQAKTSKCQGMRGILSESEDFVKANAGVRDWGIFAATQRIQHYQVACYACAWTFAEQLGYQDAARLLQQCMEEEVETQKSFTSVAEVKASDERVRTA